MLWPYAAPFITLLRACMQFHEALGRAKTSSRGEKEKKPCTVGASFIRYVIEGMCQTAGDDNFQS